MIIFLYFIAYSTNNIYQASNSNNIINNNSSNNTNTNKRQSRVVRPPSCARPTISSLRKMNRTFSLNNVSDVGVTPASAAAIANQRNAGVVNDIVTNNNQSNIVLPLTQASLAIANAAQASSSSFNSNNSRCINNNINNSNNNDDASLISRMNLLNNSNKYNSRYASSNLLQNDPMQPQQTRTTPRRRTPRNAEEFLLAAGVVDTESFLNKGYYVGSMLNLNEFTASSSIAPSQLNASHQMQLQHQQQQQHLQQQHLLNPSSSSSSSIHNNGGGNIPINYKDHNLVHQSMNLKRRNSIHDSTSVSLANLNFLNSNFQQQMPQQGNNSTLNRRDTSSNSGYFKNTNHYAKNRSATTAIVNQNYDIMNGMGQDSGSTTTGGNSSSSSSSGSGSGSDSSSSPTPLLSTQQSQVSGSNNSKIMNTSTLGPLMSAVSKMDHHHHHHHHRFFSGGSVEDEFDDYEYLERNLGADPFSSPIHKQDKSLNNRMNDINTTTNTNVTDYYTDESNSCNNEDFKHPANNNINNINLQNNNNNNTINQNNNTTLMNNNNNNLNANLTAQNYQFSITNQNNNNNNNLGLNNNNNNWDHHNHTSSLASSNSIFSGLYSILNRIKITYTYTYIYYIYTYIFLYI